MRIPRGGDDELPSQDTLKIRALEETVAAALMNGEIRLYADLLDDRFHAISITGSRFTKPEFVEHLRTISRIHLAEIRYMDVVIEGPIAVVTADWFINHVEGSSRMTGLSRLTRVWVRRSEGWKMLQVHISDARLAEAWSAIAKK